LVNFNYSLQKIDYTLSFFLNGIAFSYHQGKRTVSLIREFWDTLYIFTLKKYKNGAQEGKYMRWPILQFSTIEMFWEGYTGCFG
jgi:hypothetical protein